MTINVTTDIKGTFSQKHIAVTLHNPEYLPIDDTDIKGLESKLQSEKERQQKILDTIRYRKICKNSIEDMSKDDNLFFWDYKQKHSEEIEFANRLFKSNEALWNLKIAIPSGKEYYREGNYNSKLNVDLFNKLITIRPQQFPRYKLIEIIAGNRISNPMVYPFDSFFDCYLLTISHDIIRNRILNYVQKNCSDILSQI